MALCRSAVGRQWLGVLPGCVGQLCHAQGVPLHQAKPQHSGMWVPQLALAITIQQPYLRQQPHQRQQPFQQPYQRQPPYQCQ